LHQDAVNHGDGRHGCDGSGRITRAAFEEQRERRIAPNQRLPVWKGNGDSGDQSIEQHGNAQRPHDGGRNGPVRILRFLGHVLNVFKSDIGKKRQKGASKHRH
jgi:hypothetical protein